MIYIYAISMIKMGNQSDLPNWSENSDKKRKKGEEDKE